MTDQIEQKNTRRTQKRFWIMAAGIVAGVLVMVGAGYATFIQTAEKGAEPERLVVPLKPVKSAGDLPISGGFVKSDFGFGLASLLRGVGVVEPGGYKISKSMTAWQIAGVLKQKPYMKWVVIPEGLRKEEIADLLAENLGWTDKEKSDWINTYTAMDYDHMEGVYFPDTYLIPVDESPLDVAKRLEAKFEEKFAPLAKEAVAQNIKWTTLLKVASLVQREANGKDDMPIVAGVIWNRLLKNMRLEIDATVQYIRGDLGDGWWVPVSKEDMQIDSPYNTYKNNGLPPHPICNPGLTAIEAALHPASTTCLYYLHDKSGEIHCSNTYDEHLANVEKYLK